LIYISIVTKNIHVSKNFKIIDASIFPSVFLHLYNAKTKQNIRIWKWILNLQSKYFYLKQIISSIKYCFSISQAIAELMREIEGQNSNFSIHKQSERKVNPLGKPNKRFLKTTIRRSRSTKSPSEIAREVAAAVGIGKCRPAILHP